MPTRTTPRAEAYRRAIRLLEADRAYVAHLPFLYQQLSGVLATLGISRELKQVTSRQIALLNQPSADPLLTDQKYLLPQASMYSAIAELGLGNYSSVEAGLEHALALAGELLAPNHPHTAAILAAIGEYRNDQADHHGAVEHYRRAMEIWRRTTGDHGDAAHGDLDRKLEMGKLHVRIAYAYFDLGDRRRARDHAERSVAMISEIMGPDHEYASEPLQVLAQVEMEDGDEERAEALIRRALRIQRRVFGHDHDRALDVEGHLALLLVMAGRFDEAAAIDRPLLARMEAEGERDPVAVARVLERTALVHAHEGKLAEAHQLHRRVLTLREGKYGEAHWIIPLSLHNLVYASARLGRWDEALAAMRRANDIRERFLVSLLGAGTEEQKRFYIDSLAEETDSTMVLNLWHMRDEDATDLALRTLLQRKGRSLEVMTSSLGGLRAQADEDTRHLVDEVVRERTVLAGMILDRKVDRAALEKQQRRVDLIEAEASARGSKLAQLAPPTTVEAVQRALPEGSMLVELVAYRKISWDDVISSQAHPKHYGAYVLPATGSPRGIDLGPAMVIDPLVRSLRRALADPQRDPRQPARLLHDAVFAPIEPLLLGVTKLRISSDGLLNLVPFAALVDEQGRYLLERYDISYLTSGRDLLRVRPSASLSGDVLIGGPAFGRFKRPLTTDGHDGIDAIEFPPLPGSYDEVMQLKDWLPDATVLVGDSARESAVKNLQAPRLLHIASHGFFLPDLAVGPTRVGRRGVRMLEVPRSARKLPASLGSGIALAGANQRRGAEDGILTAFEAATLNLQGTKLVVLSACDTGVGETSSGHGVFGLRRAFVLAGAQTQIMSLWKVSDTSTRDLMLAYYARLLEGAGRGEGMRAAQRLLLADSKTAHPHHWAGFIVSGDDSPMFEAAPAPPPVARGARGCTCRIASAPHDEPSSGWLALALSLMTWARRSSRRSRTC